MKVRTYDRLVTLLWSFPMAMAFSAGSFHVLHGLSLLEMEAIQGAFQLLACAILVTGFFIMVIFKPRLDK